MRNLDGYHVSTTRIVHLVGAAPVSEPFKKYLLEELGEAGLLKDASVSCFRLGIFMAKLVERVDAHYVKDCCVVLADFNDLDQLPFVTIDGVPVH